MKINDKNFEIDKKFAAKDKFIRRVNRMFFISTLVIIIVIFLVYQPMKMELEKSLIDNFEQVAVTNYHSFENSIQRGLEGAKSLSSRTMIRSAIIDYRNGEIDLEELKTFTQSKFADGAMALDHLISAERIVDGMVIAQYKADELAYEDIIKEIKTELGTEATLEIKNNRNRVSAVITSPIMNDKEVLGVDVLVYDLDKQINMICSDKIDAEILDQDEYNKLISTAKPLKNQDEIIVLNESGAIYAVSPINDNKYFISVQALSTLLKPISQLATRIAMGGIFIFTGYVILAYVYIIRYTQKELVNLEFSRNEYKQIAYKDHLTGAYNRQFLGVWNHSIRSNHTNYVIVMTDVDDFKNINDVYGHIIGDKVLQTIGNIILKSVRQSDFLIRYGGDEFVLILSETTIEATEKLIKRIQKQLDLSNDNLPRIHLSYGTSFLTDQNDFEDLLKQADKKMYEFKFSNKAV